MLVRRSVGVPKKVRQRRHGGTRRGRIRSERDVGADPATVFVDRGAAEAAEHADEKTLRYKSEVALCDVKARQLVLTEIQLEFDVMRGGFPLVRVERDLLHPVHPPLLVAAFFRRSLWLNTEPAQIGREQNRIKTNQPQAFGRLEAKISVELGELSLESKQAQVNTAAK